MGWGVGHCWLLFWGLVLLLTIRNNFEEDEMKDYGRMDETCRRRRGAGNAPKALLFDYNGKVHRM